MNAPYLTRATRRRLTSAERIARAAGWLAEAGRSLQIPRTRAGLLGAAEGHREAAIRHTEAAATETDPRTQLTLIEQAGNNALKAQLYLAKAEEAAG